MNRLVSLANILLVLALRKDWEKIFGVLRGWTATTREWSTCTVTSLNSRDYIIWFLQFFFVNIGLSILRSKLNWIHTHILKLSVMLSGWTTVTTTRAYTIRWLVWAIWSLWATSLARLIHSFSSTSWTVIRVISTTNILDTTALILYIRRLWPRPKFA